MALTALTKQLIGSLSRGIASTKILPVVDGTVTFGGLDFSTAGQIFSIEDTLSLDWPEPTINPIKVDQNQETIAIDTEQGDITFSANYPTIAEAALKEFFKAGKAGTVKSETSVSYAGTSIFTAPQTTEVTMLIEDQDQNYGIVFARVSMTARLAYDSDNKIWYIGLDGRVLTNLKDGEGDILVGKKVSA